MRALALLALLALLAACEPAETRAEAHYQRALTLLAGGDRARAAVELRNVFRLKDDHRAARLAYARLLAASGDREGALGQYLRLAEADPRNLDGQRELAELALAAGDGETAGFHAAQALALAPGDPRMRALRATLDWHRGGRADRVRAASDAAAVAAEAPDVVAAQLLLVTDRLAAGDPAAALRRADAALARQPGEAALHLARVAALERLGDMGAVGAALGDMRARFPGDAGVGQALLAWHLRQGDTAAAEALLREAAGAAGGGPGADPSPEADRGGDPGASPGADPGPALALAAFLLEARGPEAARAELAARIAGAAATGDDAAPFRRAAAGIDFAAGRQAEAIATLRELLADAAPSDAAATDATRELQLALAEMLAATGAGGPSADVVAAILQGDPAHAGALKLRARAALAEDRPEAAIRDLRAALAEAPRDAEAMTLMAFAHGREGSRELAGERLARAVEVADRAPAESRRYAAFLLEEGRAGPAEGVVIDALRRAPGDPDLLDLLGRIHLSRGDWAGAAAVAGRLQALAAASGGARDPGRRADALLARSLAGRGRPAEGLARLGPDADPAAVAELVRGMAAADAPENPAIAARWLDARIAAAPGAETVALRLLRAEGLAAVGDAAGAGAALDAAVAAAPGRPEPHAARFRLLAATGQPEAAVAALAAGLAMVPPAAARPLRLLRAGLREATGDRAGAIADYRAVHAADLRGFVTRPDGLDGGPDGSPDGGTVDPLVANNLASLLAAGDDADLDAAFRLARQLAGSPVPQFRDTLGWILVRRGAPDRGLAELEPAAAALPGDGAVQFHRAEALRALGRHEEARTAYARALAAAAPPLPPGPAAAARAALAAPGAAAPVASGG